MPSSGRLGHRGRGRGAGARVEQAELAEHLTRAEDGQQVLPAVRARPAELDLALGDDVERLAGVALGEQLVAALEMAAAHRGAQRGRRLLVQAREQRGGTHDVWIHGRQSAARVLSAVLTACSGRALDDGGTAACCGARPTLPRWQAAAVADQARSGSVPSVGPPSRPRRRSPGPAGPGGCTACCTTSTPTRTASSTSARRWELLVATVLSAQTTDVRVNLTTPALLRAVARAGRAGRGRPGRRRGDASSRPASSGPRPRASRASRPPSSSGTTVRSRVAWRTW